MKRDRDSRWTGIGAAGAMAALATVGLLAGPASAKSIKQPLTATGADADARGRAKLALRRPSDGKFEIVVQRLEGHATFSIVANGIKVGTLTTTGGGNGRARFRSRPRGHDQLLGFDPRGGHVEVMDDNGVDVLDGDMPDDDADPADVACCLPDGGGDGEVECEDRTAEECTAAGGTVAASASCLPNPCATTPPGGEDIVCCLPGGGGEPEVECEDRTQDVCLAAGGTVVEATACELTTCSAVPAPAATVCCVPDDSGAECEVLTADRCTERNGTPSDATSCDPNPCADVPPAPEEIVCCIPNDAGVECDVLAADQCAARNGAASAATSCTPDACTQTTPPAPGDGSGGNSGSGGSDDGSGHL